MDIESTPIDCDSAEDNNSKQALHINVTMQQPAITHGQLFSDNAAFKLAIGCHILYTVHT